MQSLVLGRSPYQWQHEPVLYGFLQNGKHPWYSDRKQTTIWEYDRPKASKEHPTMKPVVLMAYPIENSSMSHCIILDPFLGSGSTLIAYCNEATVEETARLMGKVFTSNGIACHTYTLPADSEGAFYTE